MRAARGEGSRLDLARLGAAARSASATRLRRNTRQRMRHNRIRDRRICAISEFPCRTNHTTCRLRLSLWNPCRHRRCPGECRMESQAGRMRPASTSVIQAASLREHSTRRHARCDCITWCACATVNGALGASTGHPATHTLVSDWAARRFESLGRDTGSEYAAMARAARAAVRPIRSDVVSIGTFGVVGSLDSPDAEGSRAGQCIPASGADLSVHVPDRAITVQKRRESG